MTTYTHVKKTDLKKLQDYGFWLEEGKTKYEIMRARSRKAVLVLFTTNKLLVQGPEEAVKETEQILYKLKIGKKVKQIKFVKEKGIVIGSDEALKGDSFGGIVVAAVKADDSQRHDLMFAGVMDSKKLKDSEISIIAERIKKIAKYKIISVLPLEYNRYENVTDLLNKLHFEAINSLKPADLIVVDKYPGCNVHANKTIKAEQKYVEVAAASILARDAAVKQLKKLSQVLGFEVPKGSTHVSAALEKAVKSGIDLRKVAKIRFRNVKKFLHQI